MNERFSQTATSISDLLNRLTCQNKPASARNNSAYLPQNVSVLHSWLSTTQNKQRVHKLKALFAVGAKHIKIFSTWIETNLTRRGETLRIFWPRTADHWQMNKRFYSSVYSRTFIFWIYLLFFCDRTFQYYPDNISRNIYECPNVEMSRIE